MDLLRSTLPEDGDEELAERARRPFLRDAALEALAHGREQKSGAAKALARWFRQARRLGSRDRPVVSEAVYGMIRYEHLLIRAGARSPEDLHEYWCRLVSGDRFDDLVGTTPEEDLSTALSIPFLLAQQWLTQWGQEEVVKLAQALMQRAPVTVRANHARLDRDELARRLEVEGVPSLPCAVAPHGLHLGKRVALGNLDTYRSGDFEVQDASSQRFVAAIPDLGSGVRVLDLCAGAGGKSLAIAATGASVQAWDIRPQILKELRRRAQKASAEIDIAPPEELADVVVVDAPCSGTGRLRREPALRWGLEILARVDLQRELIDEAAHFVRPGGLLAYATCSLVAEENEHAAPNDGGWTEVDRQILWPHIDECDGFGWVIWRRSQ